MGYLSKSKKRFKACDSDKFLVGVAAENWHLAELPRREAREW